MLLLISATTGTLLIVGEPIDEALRPDLHRASNYRMPGGVAMCWACLAFFAGIVVLLTFEADTRQALIATPTWFVLLGLAYAWLRTRAGKR